MGYKGERKWSREGVLGVSTLGCGSAGASPSRITEGSSVSPAPWCFLGVSVGMVVVAVTVVVMVRMIVG
jgi:hypothetical protein